MPYYVVVNDPVGAQPSSIANNLWTNQDIALPGDASGDGSVDNAQVPIRMILRPGNSSTHVVGASNFTIGAAGLVGGQNYSSVIQGIPYPGWNGPIIQMHEWVSGAPSVDGSAAAISLPTEVTRVLMYNWNPSLNDDAGGQQLNDSGVVLENYVGNEVVVLAFIDPNYSVPNVDTAIKLDIDGDAEEIVNVPEAQSFSIICSMGEGLDANCTIQAFLPETPFEAGDWTISIDTETPSPNYEARVLFTWNGVGEYEPGAVTALTTTALNSFFRITPLSGHVLSRHMLFLDKYTLDAGQFAMDTGDTPITECFSNPFPAPLGNFTNNETILMTQNPQPGMYPVDGLQGETVIYNNASYSWNELIKFGRTYGSTTCASGIGGTPGYNLDTDFTSDIEQQVCSWDDGSGNNQTITPDSPAASGYAFTHWGSALIKLMPNTTWTSNDICTEFRISTYEGLPGVSNLFDSGEAAYYQISQGYQAPWEGLWLIDTASNITEQQAQEGQTANFPYDQLGYDWATVETFDNLLTYDGSEEALGYLGTSRDYLVFNNMPDYYCPSDFEGNDVVVALRNIGAYQPEGWYEPYSSTYQPKDLYIRIGGGAIENYDCETSEFNADLFLEYSD